MNKKPQIRPDQTGRNELTDDLEIEVTQVIDGHKMKIAADGTMQPDSYKIEKIEVTRIFHTPGAKKLICELSDAALRLFIFIAYSIEPANDLFYLNREYYMSKCNVRSLTTIRKAIDELKEESIIEETGNKDYFYFNPLYLFNGDRIKKYAKKTKITHTLKK